MNDILVEHHTLEQMRIFNGTAWNLSREGSLNPFQSDDVPSRNEHIV